MLVLIARELHV